MDTAEKIIDRLNFLAGKINCNYSHDFAGGNHVTGKFILNDDERKTFCVRVEKETCGKTFLKIQGLFIFPARRISSHNTFKLSFFKKDSLLLKDFEKKIIPGLLVEFKDREAEFKISISSLSKEEIIKIVAVLRGDSFRDLLLLNL